MLEERSSKLEEQTSQTAGRWRQTAGKALFQHLQQQASAGGGKDAARAQPSPNATGSSGSSSDGNGDDDVGAHKPGDPEAAVCSPFACVQQPAPGGDAHAHAHAGVGFADSPLSSPRARPPVAVRLPRSQQSLRRFASAGLVREGLSVATSSWLAMKLVWPYMAAVAIAFFVPNFIFPMCLSSRVGQWPALGTWYTLLLVLVYEAGTLLGSTLPHVKPRYPRTTVLSAACGMFVFIPAYVLGLLLNGGPGVFISLTFVMLATTNYIAALVFCLAPHGLTVHDTELVETLLVLVLTLGYILGLFLSWLWNTF